MKKVLLFIAVTAFTFLHSFAQKEINYEITERDGYSDRSLPMPEGTKIFENADESFLVSLPDGFEYILKAVGSNEIVTVNGGSVTCTCNSGNGGCHPGKAAGEYACIMKSCKTCTKGTIKIPNGDGKDYEVLGIKNMDISPLRFLSSSKLGDKSLDFLSTDELPYFNNCVESLFEFPEAKEVLNLFFSKLFSADDAKKLINGQEPSVEIVYCLADFYGNTIAIAIPKKEYNDNTLMIGGMDCKCNTNGKCPSKPRIGYSYCDASNCKSCTGSNIIKIENGGLDFQK
jgi:hypothetical protein